MSYFPPATPLGIKICGITSEEQAHAIIAAGADALGINFWPKSKRYLPPTEAQRWLPELRALTALVAVLVNPEPGLLDELLGSQMVHTLQLHGDETPEVVAGLMARGAHVIKALPVRDEASLDAIGHYACTDILLDSYNPGLYGGEGQSFPWALFSLAKQRFPEKRLILSGGLTPDNVASSIQQTDPLAIDVASSVEASPGIKDLAKVEAFIKNARRASF
jgi:phosphoribosylanthranilate isomerase